MSNHPIAVTKETFDQEVLSSEKPVIVDFWAPWCGPCKAIAPLLDKVADERSDFLKVVKIDVDSQGELAAKYMIRSIPTLMIFKDGVPEKVRSGSITAGELYNWIDSSE